MKLHIELTSMDIIEAEAEVIAASLRLKQASKTALAARTSTALADVAVGMIKHDPHSFSVAQLSAALEEQRRCCELVELRDTEEAQAEVEWELAVKRLEELQ